MLNFEYCSPTQFVFGRDVETQAGRRAKALGAGKVLLHYGSGSAVRSGLIARVRESLEGAGLQVVELGGVRPNPRSGLVYQGIELCRAQGVDFILAVGGGSAIDSAKAIALGVPYEGDFWDFYCKKAVPQSALPLGVVLTMAAAGSEGSDSAVITHEPENLKRGLHCELNRPRFSLMNPLLTATLPAYQTASGATDMMAHVLERYFTLEKGVDLTDRLCEAVLMAIIKAAPAAVKNPEDYDARAQLMWASTVAHNDSVGLGRTGDWASHQLEHELSAKYDVAHGAGLAVIFPAWMRYQMRNDTRLLCQLAVRVWGCELDFEHPERTALQGIERFEAFLKSIGMPLTFEELGAKEEDIPELAEKVKYADNGLVGNFYPLNRAAVEEVYRIACQSRDN